MSVRWQIIGFMSTLPKLKHAVSHCLEEQDHLLVLVSYNVIKSGTVRLKSQVRVKSHATWWRYRGRTVCRQLQRKRTSVSGLLCQENDKNETFSSCDMYCTSVPVLFIFVSACWLFCEWLWRHAQEEKRKSLHQSCFKTCCSSSRLMNPRFWFKLYLCEFLCCSASHWSSPSHLLGSNSSSCPALLNTATTDIYFASD